MTPTIRLSVVLPVYRNAESLESVLAEFESALAESLAPGEYEMIFVDDGSPDASFEILKRLMVGHPCIRIVKLTRNFGQVPAILAGISHANGDYVATCAADGQDPASLILAMFRKARTEQSHVVIGIRETRDESLATRVFGLAFSFLMRGLAFRNYPRGGFDCVLMSRRCYKEISTQPEKSPFLQGLVLWIGFPIATVSYHRRARLHGRSSWSVRRKLSYLWDGLIGYSYVPLHVMSALGIICATAGLVYAIVVIVARLFYNATPIGWAPLMVVSLLTSGVQMMMLSVIGQYLRRAYDQGRPRPLFLVDEIFPREPGGPPPHADPSPRV